MLKSLVAVALLSSLSTGCRTPLGASGNSDVAATGQLESAAGNILVVVVGGWMSCKQQVTSPSPVDMPLYDQAQNLVANIKAGLPTAKVHTLYACLRLKPPTSGSPVWYLRSDRPNLIYTSDAPELHNVVRAMSIELGSPAIFMMGHSYGGYVAMETAAKLSDTRLAGLYTIEPISAETCKVVDNLPATPGNPGCRQAPDTLPNVIIKANTLGWLNLHQDKGPLHSSPIAEAGNVLIDLPYGDQSHHRLGFAPQAWHLLCTSMSTTLGLAEPTNCKDITVDENGHQTGGGNVIQLKTGFYRATVPGRCTDDMKFSPGKISIRFTQCQNQFAATNAELACDLEGTCRGNLWRPGVLGNLRRLSPLQNDYFIKVTAADSYDLYPQGFNSQQRVTYRATP